MEEILPSVVTELFQKSPLLAGIGTGILVLAVAYKPVMETLKLRAKSTPSPEDDKALEKIEQSTVYKWVSYSLDWLKSVLLKNKPILEKTESKPVDESTDEKKDPAA